MTVKLNNQEFEITPNTNLLPLLTEKGFFHASGIAIAVNEEILSKEKWETYLLHENDNILIITATQGG